MTSQAVQAAEAYAAEYHKHQMYGETEPYTKHLGHVAEVLRRFQFVQEDLQIAAWLHDILEDTVMPPFLIEASFGRNVLDIVQRVTNESGKNRKERHAKTYPKIKASTDATTLKLADRIANVEYSIETNSDKLNMYLNEYAQFKGFLYGNPIHEAMWRHLDFLIGDIDGNN